MPRNKKQHSVKQEPRNRIVAARIDRLNEKESKKVAEKIKDIKRKYAPKARGTIIEGDQGSLLDYFKKLIPDRKK